tara:strand:- start:1212 stop:1355 length:144 start_codon:yes stop_codon:yes gene_type:complete
MNTLKGREVRECFILLKNYDLELYKSFGNNFLQQIGLKSTKEWWKFW